MSIVIRAAPYVLALHWFLFSTLLAANHLRVRRRRRELSIPEEKPAIRAPRSMHGLLLEGLGFLVAFLFARPPSEAGVAAAAASMACGCGSVLLVLFALRHLDLEWRIKAVVTDDHRLVTSGPYSLLRHPIFAALNLLLASTVLVVTEPAAAVAAMSICLLGTEIRVRAEDGLLRQRFGAQFESYRERVPAYLPFVR